MLAFAEMTMRLRRTRDPEQRETLVTDYLRGKSHTQVASGVLFLSAVPIQGALGRQLAVHGSIYPMLARNLFGVPRELYRACHQVSGDHGEILGRLQSPSAEGDVPIEDAHEFLCELADLQKSESKLLSLERYLAPLHPAVITCMIRIITRCLRVGLSEEQLLRAIARGLARDEQRVRAVYLETQDLSQTARLAATDAPGPAGRA